MVGRRLWLLVQRIYIKHTVPYVSIVRVIFTTPRLKYFVGGVLNIMHTVDTKTMGIFFVQVDSYSFLIRRTHVQLRCRAHRNLRFFMPNQKIKFSSASSSRLAAAFFSSSSGLYSFSVVPYVVRRTRNSVRLFSA